MNRLALGTAQFGLHYGIANQSGKVALSTARALLQFAARNDIDTIDTAISYGDSETCLGEIGTENFKIVTKLPPIPDNFIEVSNWVAEQFSLSLGRLNVTEVYGLLLHKPEQLLGSNGKALYRALRVLQDNGQVNKIGVSIYAPTELDELIPQFEIDLVQAPFNVIDRCLYSTGWLSRLKELGLEVHTRSTFLQGLLLMETDEMPYKFARWNSLWLRWQKWLKDRNISSIQACLAFPLSFPEIDRVVVGVESVSQLEQILSSAINFPELDLPDIQCSDVNLINPSRWHN
jgi:aryl-alcohol dehydrogenase-like predicted oxidoreductase